MAIAVKGGHVSRALDFYNAKGKYFIIGGTKEWDIPNTPPNPEETDFRLVDVVGLKKVTREEMVIPTESTNNVISYRNQNWKVVQAKIETRLSSGVAAGSDIIVLDNVTGLSRGSKIRIGDIYEGTILSESVVAGQSIKLDSKAPVSVVSGTRVIGGALVEGAKYVYVECSLDYEKFPVKYPDTGEKYFYRQIGLCTNVESESDTLLSAAFSNTKADEYHSIGILEVLDNRVPASRDVDQKEKLSLIIEF